MSHGQEERLKEQSLLEQGNLSGIGSVQTQIGERAWDVDGLLWASQLAFSSPVGSR